MKVHFSLRKQLKPILTAGMPKRQGNRLYTQYNNSIVETNVETFEILREIPFEAFKCFDVRDDCLVVCSSDVMVYDLSRGMAEETVRLAKAEICAVFIDDMDSEQEQKDLSAVVGRIDGSVSKIDLVRKRLIWSYKMANAVIKMMRFGDVVCSCDANEVWVYKEGNELLKYQGLDVVGIAYDRDVCTVTGQGILTRWGRTPQRIQLGIRCDCMFGDGRFLYVCSGGEMHVYDYGGRLQCRREILGSRGAMRGVRRQDASFEDESEVCSEISRNVDEVGSSVDCYEDESGSDDELKRRRLEIDVRNAEENEKVEVNDGMSIENISMDLMVTTEQEIFLIDGGFEVASIIIGNNDEITDIKQWNDVLFVATNSGRLRYAFIEDCSGNYAFEGRIVPAHDETIMSLSISGDFLMTASQDKRAILWKITMKKAVLGRGREVLLRRIRTFGNNLDGVNGCALGTSVFVLAGSDRILQIWNYRENVFMERIHEKEINGVEVNEERRIIATSSQDRSVRILSFEGKTLHVLSGHSKGVWSVSFGKNVMATCSADSTVKLWEMETFRCIGTLSGHRSGVLRGIFYMNDERLITGCVTGEVKIWNVRKKTCEMNIDVHKNKVWALIGTPLLVTSGGGSIAFFHDDSLEKASEELKKRSEKEMRFVEVEKCLRSNLNVKAIEILSKTDDYEQLFRAMIRCYREGLEEMFDVFENKQQVFFEAILRQGTFKNCGAVHWLVGEGLRRRWRVGKETMEKIYNVVRKHSCSIDEIYTSLLGFTIFER